MIQNDGPAVLIVDDEAFGALESAEKLQRGGMAPERIKSVHSANAAIQTIKEFHPELVLMDIKFHERDYEGIDAARAIKRLFGIPVIFLTVYRDRARLKRAWEDGVVAGYLQKFETTEKELYCETMRVLHNAELAARECKDLFAAFDSSRIVRSCSALMAKFVFGADPEDVVGRDFYECLADSLKGQCEGEQDPRRLLADGRDQSMQWTIRYAESDGVPVTLTCTQICLNDAVIGVRIAGEDPRMQIYQYLFEDRVDLRVAAQKMLGIVGRPATDIDGGVSVTFSGVAEGEEPKDELSRVFPKERLDDANAGFRQARVGYEVFSLGPCNVSKMTNEGPTFEELTSPQRDPLSDVDFERLQKKE